MSLNPAAVDAALAEATPSASTPAPEAPASPEPPAGPAMATLPADELAAIRSRASSAEALEREISATRAESAINAGLAGVAFVHETAARQARKILAADVVVERDTSGNLVALDRETRRPAAEAIREAVAGPDFALFRAASHQGGNLPTNANLPTYNNPKPPFVPQTYGEAMIAATVAKSKGGMPGVPFGHMAQG